MQSVFVDRYILGHMSKVKDANLVLSLARSSAIYMESSDSIN